jgi:uncharacterized damage-inducible protein DinB
MRTSRFSLPAVLLLVGAAATLPAQGTVQSLDDAEQKMVGLAQAVPQEKFTWRPATGVRSISEVFMHVVGANLFIPTFAGVPRDTSVALSRDSETKVTDKAQVVDLLKKSFAHAKRAVMAVPDAELEAEVKLFGQPSTKRGVLVLVATHAHEHVGQSIAYARMNGVTPPWSQGAGGDR